MPRYKVVQVKERQKFYDNELDYVAKMEIIMNEQAEVGYRLPRFYVAIRLPEILVLMAAPIQKILYLKKHKKRE